MATRKWEKILADRKVPRLNVVKPERREIVNSIKELINTASAREDEESEVSDYTTLMDKYMVLLHEHCISSTGGKRTSAVYARAYAELREVDKWFAEWGHKLGLVLDAYTALMADQFQEDDLSSIRLSNGQLVSTFREPHASVDDPEKFRLWCIEQGMEAKMQLPWPATNSLIKDILTAGDPEPPGTSVWGKTSVRLGKGDDD